MVRSLWAHISGSLQLNEHLGDGALAARCDSTSCAENQACNPCAQPHCYGTTSVGFFLLAQITWSQEVARWLHALPLLAALLAARYVFRLRPRETAGAAGRVLGGVALTMLLPAAAGILRVMLLGGPSAVNDFWNWNDQSTRCFA